MNALRLCESLPARRAKAAMDQMALTALPLASYTNFIKFNNFANLYPFPHPQILKIIGVFPNFPNFPKKSDYMSYEKINPDTRASAD